MVTNACLRFCNISRNIGQISGKNLTLRATMLTSTQNDFFLELKREITHKLNVVMIDRQKPSTQYIQTQQANHIKIQKIRTCEDL